MFLVDNLWKIFEVGDEENTDKDATKSYAALSGQLHHGQGV